MLMTVVGMRDMLRTCAGYLGFITRGRLYRPPTYVERPPVYIFQPPLDNNYTFMHHVINSVNA